MNLFASATWLNVNSNVGYGSHPIPQLRDDEITDLIASWIKLEPSERQIAAQSVLESQRFTLLTYSERMASLAVRTGDAKKIFLGLLALGIDGWKSDWRDNVTVICLHFDAAKRISVDPAEIFDSASSLLSLKVSTALRSFLQREPADQTLEAMGYSASKDSDGFRYLRTW